MFKKTIIATLIAITSALGFVGNASAAPNLVGHSEADAVRFMNEQSYPYIISSRYTASGERECRVTRIYDRGERHYYESDFVRVTGENGERKTIIVRTPKTEWKGYALDIGCS